MIDKQWLKDKLCKLMGRKGGVANQFCADQEEPLSYIDFYNLQGMIL